MKNKAKLPEYPPEHEEAYQTLGIVLGDEEFDKRMEALKYLCQYYFEKKVVESE